MQKGRLLIFSILISFILPTSVLAQSIKTDTSFLRQSVSNSIQSYKDALGLQIHLYTGTEYYVPFKQYIDGHQFFEEKTFENGAVLYDDAWFYEVPMLYDIAMDEVVTIHPGSGLSQKMIKQKLSTFILRGHTFIQLNEDSLKGFSMTPGFYDFLYNGHVKALVRREKHLQERVSNNGFEGNYDVTDKIYIKKDGVYFLVRDKRSVLKVLHDKKKELKTFIRTNKLKFRKQRESTILAIIRHYDTLI